MTMSKDGDSTTSPGNPCQRSVTLTAKVFPDVQRDRPVCQCVSPLVPSRGTAGKSPAGPPLHPPPGTRLRCKMPRAPLPRAGRDRGCGGTRGCGLLQRCRCASSVGAAPSVRSPPCPRGNGPVAAPPPARDRVGDHQLRPCHRRRELRGRRGSGRGWRVPSACSLARLPAQGRHTPPRRSVTDPRSPGLSLGPAPAAIGQRSRRRAPSSSPRARPRLRGGHPPPHPLRAEPPARSPR